MSEGATPGIDKFAPPPERLLKARADAKSRGVDTMTLAEINAAVSATRAEKLDNRDDGE